MKELTTVAVIDGQGIKYREDLGDWSVYELHIDGRCVLEASVNNTDPKLTICVGKPGATWNVVHGAADLKITGPLIETAGYATKGLHEVGGTPTSPGDIKDHIDGISIQNYVLTRVVRLLADVHVPRHGVAGELNN